jgi:tetratricopeptide (TPR) repeat protein
MSSLSTVAPASVSRTGTDQVIPVPPVPPRIDEGADYDTCLGMLPADPSGAAAFAESWRGRGGGDGAAHCQALATVALGDPAGGAAALDRLAQGSRGPVAARASIAGQAAQSWLMAGQAESALASADTALGLYGDDPDLLMTHATAALLLSRADAAVADLDRVLTLDPTREDALVLRASAHRAMGAFGLAGRDVAAALALDPDDPDALLERGIVRQHGGDLDGARQDWERTMSAAPDTPAADLAQQNIALLEAGPETR